VKQPLEVSRETSWIDAESPADVLVRRAAGIGVALSLSQAAVLVALLDRIALEAQNLTAIDSLEDGIARHLLDSLSGWSLPSIRYARSLVDLGSGAGFPGIPLATISPDCAVTLVESEGRKADWLVRASGELPNVRVVADRTENLARGERERWDVATARAVAPLPTAVELAAPLVAVGGAFVAWRGPRDPDEEARAVRAAEQLGFGIPVVTAVEPFPGAMRHLHAYPKVSPTPERYPRRPGRAAKRPLA
jgi:16S rRNA (guanine527-N7)-methyltransferase